LFRSYAADYTHRTMPTSRYLPTIVITGTPGTGKSTLAELLVKESPISLTHVEVSELVKDRHLYENYDKDWDTYTVDEDKASDNDLRH
jgi:adenylate kinase